MAFVDLNWFLKLAIVNLTMIILCIILYYTSYLESKQERQWESYHILVILLIALILFPTIISSLTAYPKYNHLEGEFCQDKGFEFVGENSNIGNGDFEASKVKCSDGNVYDIEIKEVCISKNSYGDCKYEDRYVEVN